MAAENNELGSKLGFDVSDAVSALSRLKRELDSYSANLLKIAGTTDKFNKEQAEVDRLLTAAAASSERAARGLKSYATAANAAEAEARKFLNTAKKLQLTSFSAGAPPLEQQAAAGVQRRQEQIAQEVAALQNLTDRKAIQAFNEKIRLQTVLNNAATQRDRQQARGADQDVFAAFGRNPQLTRLPEEATRAKALTTKEFNDIGISYKGLLKIFATQIVFAAIGNFSAAAKKAIQDAIGFETQLGRIQTISEEFKARGLNATADAVRALSDQFGQPIEDVASGLYETLSNQIGNAAESTQFLTEALIFSKGAVTTTADSVDLLSGVINSYGLTTASTANIADQLFVTIDKGRVKGEELANTFGRLLPLASTLGIDLASVNTALAELTIQGVKPADALTQLTNVMLKLIKPTEALQAVFDDMGIASAEAGVAIFGFDGFIREITKNAGSSATEIGELFNQIRGTRGVIGIISRDNQKYADTLEEIRNASRETSRALEAANTVLQTPAQQLTIELNKARNFLINDFGRSAIGFFNFLTQNILSAKNATVLFGSAIAAVGTIFGAAGLFTLVNQLGVALTFINKQFLFMSGTSAAAAGGVSRLTLALGGLAIAVAGITLAKVLLDANRFTEQANDAILARNALLADSVKQEVVGIQEGIEARKDAVRKNLGEMTAYFSKLQQGYNKDKESANRLQENISADFKNQLDKRTSLFDRFIEKLEQTQAQAQQNIQGISERGRDNTFQQNANRFERDVSTRQSPEQVANALITRAQKILQAARKAFQEGTPQGTEFGNKLLSEAFDLANRVAEAPATRQRGEGLINKLLQEQTLIQREQIEIEQQKAAAAKQTEDNIKATVLETKRQIDEFNKLQEFVSKEQLAGGKNVDEAQFNKAKARIGELGGLIEQNLNKIGTSNIPKILGLEDLQRQITAPFVDPFTRQLGSLKGAAVNAMTAVTAELQKTANATPVEIKVLIKALTGKDLGVEGFGAAQNASAGLSKQLTQNIENEKFLPSLRAQIEAGKADINDFLGAVIQTGTQASLFTTNLSQGFEQLRTGTDAATEKFKADLRALQERGVQAAISGNATELEEVRKKLLEMAQAAKGATQTQAGDSLATTIAKRVFGDFGTGDALAQQLTSAAQGLKTLAENQQRLNEAESKAKLNQRTETAINTGDSAELLLLETLNKIQQKNAEAGAAFNASFQTGIVTADTVSTTFMTDLQNQSTAAGAAFGTAFTQSVAQAQAAAATLPTGPAQGKARGGLMAYLAGGGFAPRGTDTVPAMLSPGEFVVNAKSARNFYSELVAINSGVKPVYRAGGGEISNVSIGDINVNVPASRSGKVSGRELAKDLRRELRRRTSKRF